VLGVTPKLHESLFATEVEYLFRIAYRLTGDSHDAEDLVQDVCERALRSAPGLASLEEWRRWMLRVLYNRFVDGLRHRQRSPIVASAAASLATESAAADHSFGPEEIAARRDDETILMRAWERLLPEQQMLLMLRAEGHDLGEIADILEIEKPALSSRLHRARSTLGRYLEEERSAQSLRAVPEQET
jgi:RNA polymerase sigma factor (sigma-70 family)